MATCNARDPGGPLRCEHDFNHDGDHGSEVNGKLVTWPNRRDKPTRELGGRTTTRRRPMRQVSEPQQIDTDVVTGIMAERVAAEIDRHPYSPVFFCQCKLVEGGEGCMRSETNAQAVLDNWHPHHIEKRRNGPKANRHNVFRSRSRPDNIAIVTPECHDRIEANNPEFSRSEP